MTPGCKCASLCAAVVCAILAAPLAAAEVRVDLLTGYPFAPGAAANEDSHSAYLSPNGRYLALTSQANNLVAGFTDHNGFPDAVVLDRQTGVYDYVAVAAGTTDRAPERTSSAIAVSDDGRWALFSSFSHDLVAGATYPDSSSDRQLYLFDRLDRVTRLVSHVPGQPLVSSSDYSTGIRLSADGGLATLVTASAANPGRTANAGSTGHRISDDGVTIYFTSTDQPGRALHRRQQPTPRRLLPFRPAERPGQPAVPLGGR